MQCHLIKAVYFRLVFYVFAVTARTDCVIIRFCVIFYFQTIIYEHSEQENVHFVCDKSSRQAKINAHNQETQQIKEHRIVSAI